MKIGYVATTINCQWRFALFKLEFKKFKKCIIYNYFHCSGCGHWTVLVCTQTKMLLKSYIVIQHCTMYLSRSNVHGNVPAHITSRRPHYPPSLGLMYMITYLVTSPLDVLTTRAMLAQNKGTLLQDAKVLGLPGLAAG